jgi:hypothetical protein
MLRALLNFGFKGPLEIMTLAGVALVQKFPSRTRQQEGGNSEPPHSRICGSFTILASTSPVTCPFAGMLWPAEA